MLFGNQLLVMNLYEEFAAATAAVAPAAAAAVVVNLWLARYSSQCINKHISEIECIF